MSTNQKLTLRKQFQDAYLYNNREMWNGVKLMLSMFFALLSVESGLVLWATKYGNSPYPLLIIPLVIIALCIFGYFNAKHYYEAVLLYIACMAKVEDELDLTRKDNPSFFRDDKNILYKGWLKDREKYDTTDEFKNALAKVICNPKGWKNAFAFIGTLYLSIIAIFFIIILIVII